MSNLNPDYLAYAAGQVARVTGRPVDRTDPAFLEALRAGISYASDIRPGDAFRGVSPEAHERFPTGLQRETFMLAAIDHLPEIWTGWGSDIILQVERHA